MRKAAPATPNPLPFAATKLQSLFCHRLHSDLFVPVLVLPYVLDNAFNTPKTVLMLLGVCLMQHSIPSSSSGAKRFRSREAPFPSSCFL